MQTTEHASGVLCNTAWAWLLLGSMHAGQTIDQPTTSSAVCAWLVCMCTSPPIACQLAALGTGELSCQLAGLGRDELTVSLHTGLVCLRCAQYVSAQTPRFSIAPVICSPAGSGHAPPPPANPHCALSCADPHFCCKLIDDTFCTW